VLFLFGSENELGESGRVYFRKRLLWDWAHKGSRGRG
jgi:hypothetical protein